MLLLRGSAGILADVVAVYTTANSNYLSLACLANENTCAHLCILHRIDSVHVISVNFDNSKSVNPNQTWYER